MTDRYRKKPVEVRAWKIDFDGDEPGWVREAFDGGRIDWCPAGEGLYINTLEGRMKAGIGDMLIEGVKGELYGCRADIFAATYEPVAQQEAPEATITLEQAEDHAHICSKLAEEHKDDALLFAALTDAAAIIRDLMRGRLQAEAADFKADSENARLRRGAHPAITHCDNCGCDWLDNGLNPVGCPYCELRRETERRLEGNRRAAQEYVEDMRDVLQEAAQICRELDDEALAKEGRLACGTECAAAIADLAARMDVPFERT
jgi:uncharacterized Zn finger protein (UPF0148 family)